MVENPTGRLRVAHVTEASAGGVRQHLHHVLPGLRARGLELALVVSDRRAAPGFAADLAVWRDCCSRVDVLPMRRRPAPLADLLALVRLRARLHHWRPHVLHLHAAKAGLLGRLAARFLPGTAVCHSPHAFAFEAFPPGLRHHGLRAVERFLKRRTDCLIAVSPAERELARRACGFSEDRICLAENGLPADFAESAGDRVALRAAWGLPPDAFVIGVPGRLAHQKGQDWFLNALPEVVAGFGQACVRVCFCGSGPAARACRHQSASLGLDSVVSWLGHVPELGHCLRAFDVVVLPSRYEGLPYVLLEALALGVPLVVSDIPGHLPRPAMRSAVITVPLGDRGELARGIAAIHADAEGAMARARLGTALVRTEFTLESQLARLCACYAAVATGKGVWPVHRRAEEGDEAR